MFLAYSKTLINRMFTFCKSLYKKHLRSLITIIKKRKTVISGEFTQNMPLVGNAGIGKIVLTLAVCLFSYYVFWIFILPFMLLDQDNVLYSFFPHLKYAFILPTILGVLVISSTSIYTIYHMKHTPQLLATN